MTHDYFLAVVFRLLLFFYRFMISFCLMQQPQVGKMVRPAMEMATGTSSLHGSAIDATTQHAWHCALMKEQPSHSGLIPTQQHGKRHGAPHLQQHSKLQQQIPACCEV
jgi:hypothetical protein